MRIFKDKNGEEIDYTDWLNKFKDDKYRVIEITDIGEDKYVSTIWTGADLYGSGLIFETCLVTRDVGGDVKGRTESEEEARKLHKDVVDSFTS